MLVAHAGAELYGADRMLAETVEALISAGADVTVVVPREGPLTEHLTRAGAAVTVCPMPVLRRSSLRPSGAVRLVIDALTGARAATRLVRSHGQVYVNTVTLPSWVLLARVLRRRVTCHVHEAERMTPLVLRRLLSLPVTLADQIIVNSDVTGSVLEESAPRTRGRAIVVHNGVPGPPTVTPPRPRLDDPVRVLYVGRLSPRKGPGVAVEAVSLLRNRSMDVRLDLIGSVFPGYEWFEAELRTQIRQAGLEDDVRLLGFRPDIWPMIATSDVVVVPSVGDESFGNAAAEAVLAGRPLIISAIPGLQEAVAEFSSVQVVPPGDAAELAQAVERAALDWSTYSARAVEDSHQAHERFAPARYAAEMVRLLLMPARTDTGSPYEMPA